MKGMYHLLALIVFVLFLGSCGASGPVAGGAPITDEFLGMSPAQLLELRPDAYQDQGNPQRYIRQGSVYSLDGRWMYEFIDGKLSWYVFTAHRSDISPEVFSEYLQVARDLSDSWDREYGKPTKVRRGIQEYQDPQRSSHDGYMVYQANWDLGDSRRTVEFTFLGDHRNYSLLMTVQVGR